ncbi:MAG: BamA/TamA family outer membrane protein [Candidatus Cloacimonetes bacterium]|nr:BamA/TamA family outer membrane protein [Candidatus Cloacimonadota bacterium]
MKKLIILLILLMLCLLLIAKEDYFIGKVQFVGNNTISDARLLKNLIIKPENLAQRLLFWKKTAAYTEMYLDDDIQRIIADYQREGFLNVKVEVKKEINAKTGKINLLYYIQEHNPILVNNIELEIISPTPEIQNSVMQFLVSNKENWPLQNNRRFRDADVFALRKVFFNLLLNRGFPSSDIEQEIIFTDKKKKVDVVYTISTGKLCKFGNITVLGNERTSTKVIKKQLSFQDKQYSQNLLQENQRRIQQLGVFKYVTMKSLLDQIESDRLPIEIFVQEMPEWSVKFGIGYGLEDRFRASVNLLKLNFLGDARSANVYIKHSYLEPYNLSLKITQPALFGPYNSLISKSFVKKEKESAYTLESFGSIMTFQNIITSSLSGFFSYRFERSLIDLANDIEDNPLKEYYNKSTVSQGMNFDDSEPAFYPDRGLFAAYSFSISGLKLKSKYHYVQGLIDIRKYNELWADLVFAGRVKLGAMKPIWGDQATPLEERFYAGGSTSIRGWSRSRVGPKNETGTPIGGNSYLEFSAELRQKIYKFVYLVVFMDAGNVWKEYNAHDLNELKYSPGAGLRFKTPIGPLRLDVAQPLWDEKSSVQIHLNIGHAF